MPTISQLVRKGRAKITKKSNCQAGLFYKIDNKRKTRMPNKENPT